jgi:hypothetical protein
MSIGLISGERNLTANFLNNTADEHYPAVDLREFKSQLIIPGQSITEGLNPTFADGQSNKVSFAKDGFQTFQVDIPNKFRGKMATLRFEVTIEGNKTVYLDDVFFKSKHLLFGNPQIQINNPNLTMDL